MFGMYECENSSLKRFFQSILCQMYHILVIEIMSKIIYSAKAGKFGPCDWPDNMLIYGLGGETEQHPELRQYLIGQHTILGCGQKPS